MDAQDTTVSTFCPMCGVETAPCAGTSSHRLRNVAQGLESAHSYLKKSHVFVQVFSHENQNAGVQRKFPLPFGCPFRIDCGHGVIATASKAVLHRFTRDFYLICHTDATLRQLSDVLYGHEWEAASPIPEFVL